MAELADLAAISGLLAWDRSTMMPAGGLDARGHQAATLEGIAHARMTDPEVGRLLDALEPWADGLDPDSDEARVVAVVRRDFEKARRVPETLAAEMARAESTGEGAWMRARESGRFSDLRDALSLHLELRHRYAACFDDYAHPYDVLLDDYEHGLRLDELRPLLAGLREGLVPLVAAAASDRDAADGALRGSFRADRQRRVLVETVRAMGFDEQAWRLDTSEHPFASSQSTRDIRITTHYDETDLGVALYSVLHEFGHGLYEAQVAPHHSRTPLAGGVSLGVHESQSRLWENMVGRSRPFCGWLLPRLQSGFPELGGLDAGELYRSVNAVRPSLIRIYADEATYNLHILLRTELEAGLMEGGLAVDDLPEAWNEGMHRLLGVDVPDDAHGVLQDIHWGVGLFGYFPTYTLGNLVAAQLWERARSELGDVDGLLARGEFEPLRRWLQDNVHSHGRKYPPRELLQRVTGETLRAEPLLAYLRDKLVDAGSVRTR